MLSRLLVLVCIHQLGGNLPLMSCWDRSVRVHLRFLLRSLFSSMEAAHAILLILVSQMLSTRHFQSLYRCAVSLLRSVFKLFK